MTRCVQWTLFTIEHVISLFNAMRHTHTLIHTTEIRRTDDKNDHAFVNASNGVILYMNICFVDFVSYTQILNNKVNIWHLKWKVYEHPSSYCNTSSSLEDKWRWDCVQWHYSYNCYFILHTKHTHCWYGCGALLYTANLNRFG